MSYLTEVNCSTILEAIKKEKLNQKSLAEKQKHDDYVEINPEENTFWTGLFANCFLCTSSDGDGDESSTAIKNELTHDDLLFFVSKINVVDETMASNNNSSSKIEVYRRDSRKLPCLTDFNYDWEETVYLNLILHQFEYTLTCAICTQTSDKDLEIIKRHSKRVFASPSKRDLESKGTEESITYPFIYFTVDDFDEAFNEIIVKEGQMVCVELVANNSTNIRKVLFLGSIRYEALKKVYDARASTGSKLVEKMSLGSLAKKRVEFIKMKGPGGKGYAQMAISQYQTPPPVTTDTSNIPYSQSSNEIDSFQQLFKLPVGFRKKSHTTSSSGTTSLSPDVELKDFRQESNSNGGGGAGSSFWNKTLSQFNLFTKPKTVVATASTSLHHHSGEQQEQDSRVVWLNSYLTYVTLNIQSMMNDIIETRQKSLLTY